MSRGQGGRGACPDVVGGAAGVTEATRHDPPGPGSVDGLGRERAGCRRGRNAVATDARQPRRHEVAAVSAVRVRLGRSSSVCRRQKHLATSAFLNDGSATSGRGLRRSTRRALRSRGCAPARWSSARTRLRLRLPRSSRRHRSPQRPRRRPSIDRRTPDAYGKYRYCSGDGQPSASSGVGTPRCPNLRPRHRHPIGTTSSPCGRSAHGSAHLRARWSSRQRP